MTKKFAPHLATDVQLDRLTYPVMVFPKYDGVRMLNRDGKAVGRSLKAFANKHITQKYSQEMFHGMDGELTFGDINSDSLCRDTTGCISRIQGEPDVVWNLFDYVTDENKNEPYFNRYSQIEKLLLENKHLVAHNITLIPYTWCINRVQVENMYAKCLDQGMEGIIIRNPDSPTKYGRCTLSEGAYLRMKPSVDREATVVSLVEAEANLNEAKINELGYTERSSHQANKVGKGMIGMLQCRDIESGMLINVGAGKLTHDEREYYWNNTEQIVGKMIKYRSLDTGTKDGVPRHARYLSIRDESDYSV
jgi:DNA ligase-1